MALPLDAQNERTEIGWRLTKASWGQGFGYEACETFIGLLGFDSTATELVATIHEGNIGSIALAKKLDMVLTHEERVGDANEKVYVLSRGEQ